MLTKNDFQRLEKLSGLPEDVIRTVMAVEAGGSGFTEYNGEKKPKILFEPHLFHANTKGTYDVTSPDISKKNWDATRASGHYNLPQWPTFLKAYALNPDAAIKSTSWGVGQVLGSNYKAAGFSSLKDFMNAMNDEFKQALAMIKFITSNSKMKEALKNHDWDGFAALYNGPQYKKNKYQDALAAAFKKVKKKIQEVEKTVEDNPVPTVIGLLAILLVSWYLYRQTA